MPEMIFGRLADLVVRHHRKILVAWLVILIFAAPAVMKVNEVLAYQESEMVEGDSESLVAQRVIDEQFPVVLANSTLMVLVDGPDMTGLDARDFALSLEGMATESGALAYLEDFSSVYSIYRMMVASVALEMGPAMHETEYQVNASASLLYGIPAAHMGNWVYATDPNATVAERDAQAYALTIAYLDSMLSAQDPMTAQATYDYYGLFADSWNSTSENGTLVADPVARTEHSIGVAAPQYVSSLAYPDDQKAVMYAVLDAFDLSTFSNATLVHAFTLSTVASMAGMDDLAFLESVYSLGPDYTYDGVYALAAQVISTSTIPDYPVELPEEYTASFLSPDNGTMLIVLSFSKDSGYLEEGVKPIVENVGALRDMVAAARTDGLPASYSVYVTGDAALTADMEESMAGEMGLIEPITIIMIIVLMGFFFRSVVAQFLPLGSVMVALGVSQAIVFVVGSFVADIHYSVTMMLFSILMGVGTDYAIFIVARYREERIKGFAREPAVRTSVTWAGESITTSGATVMISFFALSIADFAMIRTMGLVLGMAIGISLLVALTLVPSLLMLLGNRVFWPNNKKRWYKYAGRVMERREAGHRGYFHKAATFSITHAKAVLLAAVLISIPSTYVFVTAETSFDFIGGMASGVESSQGIVEMTDAFGAGRIMPTEVVMTMPSPVYSGGSFDTGALDAVRNLTDALSSLDNVKQVTGPTNPKGTPIDYANLSALSPTARAETETLMLEDIGIDNRTVLMTVILEAGPMTPESLDTIEDMRDAIRALAETEPLVASSEVYVGGATAVIFDLANDLNEQFTVMEVLVVIGIFLVLLVVLGAVLLSLFAILSILMSISWAFAATVAIFGYGLNEPILWIIPLILFIMLMGIGMDYNVFILTRIREERHKGKKTKEAVVDALDWTGGIITALAIIMGTAFSMMMISSTMMLREIGFALAFAIMLDAMVVRTYIVPAIMSLLGKRVWWAPGRLQRERDEPKSRAVRKLKE